MMPQPYHVQLASKRASNWADSTEEVTFTLGAVSDATPKEGDSGAPAKARCSCFAKKRSTVSALMRSLSRLCRPQQHMGGACRLADWKAHHSTHAADRRTGH